MYNEVVYDWSDILLVFWGLNKLAWLKTFEQLCAESTDLHTTDSFYSLCLSYDYIVLCHFEVEAAVFVQILEQFPFLVGCCQQGRLAFNFHFIQHLYNILFTLYRFVLEVGMFKGLFGTNTLLRIHLKHLFK